jgi:regulator of CtrA degradation
MEQTANLNPRIIDALYHEGLMLSDEVRTMFGLSRSMPVDADEGMRLAFSCEALRTTTRMMHAMAWLLNHRAYFMGEISEFQLRRHGRIVTRLPEAKPGRVALLAPAMQDLIRTTERFYARLVRLDAGWRDSQRPATGAPAIQRLRERLAKMVG